MDVLSDLGTELPQGFDIATLGPLDGVGMPFFGSRLRPSYELVDEGIGVILLIKTQLLPKFYVRHGKQPFLQPPQHGVIITGPRRKLLNFPVAVPPADD